MGQLKQFIEYVVESLVSTGNLLTLHALSLHMIGEAKRIWTLIETLRILKASGAKKQNENMVEGEDIRFDNVQVFTPTKNHLVKDLSFAIGKGDNLLLTGHNGAGKSSIFRCLGGLWPIPSGKIVKPGASVSGLHADIYYLPQKPYNVLGSLKDQLIYPLSPEDASLTIEDVVRLLKMVDLEYLTSQVSEAEINWEQKLSLGEQQRLAMARLFYHRPSFAILDECTSAVSTVMEEFLYDQCKALGITYITICHRPALRVFHKANLNLTGDGNGGWEFVPIDQEKERISYKSSRRSSGSDEVKTQTVATLSEEYLKKRSQKYSDLGKPKKLPPRKFFTMLRSLFKIMIPGSRRLMMMLISSILLRTALYESYSFIVGQLLNSSLQRDLSKFGRFAVLNVFQDLFAAVVDESVIYFEACLAKVWYENMTKHVVDKYFRENAFYNCRNLDRRISDPDQRITNEVRELADHFSDIWGHAITPFFDIFWFSWRLFKLLHAKDMGTLIAYVVGCSVAMGALMPNYQRLYSQEKDFESKFRFVHTRVRTHAESIAFFGGDEREKQIAEGHFNDLIRQMIVVRQASARFSFLYGCVNKDYEAPSTNIISTPESLNLFLQWRFAMGQVKDSSSDGYGRLAQQNFYLQNAINRTIHSFGKLSNLYQHLMQLLGAGTRVSELLDVFEELHVANPDAVIRRRSSIDEHIDTKTLEVSHVDLVTPTGLCLAEDLSVKIDVRESLMVTGQNGAGKTSFFRVVAGLWPVQNEGHIIRPMGKRSVFLVPQKPYSVVGTLADQITYPNYFSERTPEINSRVLQCLELVGVAYLVEREGGLDSSRIWEDTLSLGEQQRIGISRLFFHEPLFAVLDECTDAVSAEVERKLYSLLAETGITCITISKRLALSDFHKKELKLGQCSPCGWVLENLT
eukprot:TRINITY_DN14561_c0_g1_i1.p1 TRINITY_DN14561_c0_g1~~TRINITY_DN14561_c0_g1_i1.p1  ORF type:complete len:1009 (-),score=245.67 TRINITY_DN14561_c0_g1_i1:54-2798(-)